MEGRLRLKKKLIDESVVINKYTGDTVYVRTFDQTDLMESGLSNRYILELNTRPKLKAKDPTTNSRYVKSTWQMDALRYYAPDKQSLYSDSFKEELYKFWNVLITGERKEPYVYKATKVRKVVNNKDVSEGYSIGDVNRQFDYIQSIYTLDPTYGNHNPIKEINVLDLLDANDFNWKDFSHKRQRIIEELIERDDRPIYYNLPLYVHGRMVQGFIEDELPIVSETTDGSTNSIGIKDLALQMDKSQIDKAIKSISRNEIKIV